MVCARRAWACARTSQSVSGEKHAAADRKRTGRAGGAGQFFVFYKSGDDGCAAMAAEYILCGRDRFFAGESLLSKYDDECQRFNCFESVYASGTDKRKDAVSVFLSDECAGRHRADGYTINGNLESAGLLF